MKFLKSLGKAFAKIGLWALNWYLTIIMVIVMAAGIIVLCLILIGPLILCSITGNPTWIVLYLPILGVMTMIDYKRTKKPK